jgi:hypothetical protein
MKVEVDSDDIINAQKYTNSLKLQITELEEQLLEQKKKVTKYQVENKTLIGEMGIKSETLKIATQAVSEQQKQISDLTAQNLELEKKNSELTKAKEIAELAIDLLAAKPWQIRDIRYDDYLFLFQGSYCYMVDDSHIPVNQTQIREALFYAMAESIWQENHDKQNCDEGVSK